jgi:hypothetical protein
MQDNKAEHTAETRAVCQLQEDKLSASCRKTTGQKIRAASFLIPHYADPGAGSDAVGRQVIQIAQEVRTI